jgi:MFS family permease
MNGLVLTVSKKSKGVKALEMLIIIGGSLIAFIASINIQKKLSLKHEKYGWTSVLNLLGLLTAPMILIFIAAALFPQPAGGGIGWLLVFYIFAFPVVATIAILILYTIHKRIQKRKNPGGA